jgi:F-type H+-transporting ATPase subunit delta
MVIKAARRYANAMLVTAVEQKILESIKDDMLLIKQTISDSSELSLFLKSPIIKKEVKLSALEAIFEGKIETLTSNLITILSNKGREYLLHGITLSFMELYYEHENIIEVNVNSAFELTEDEQASLKKKLEDATGKSVLMNIIINEDLIGGLTVRIADTVIDGSVKHKLNQLKIKFTTAVE